MVTVKHLLKSKPTKTTYSISPDVSVLDAMRMMYKHSIGCLIVLDHESIVGIITERDYARKLGQGLHASSDLRVRDVMTKNVIFVTPEHSSNECLKLMTGKKLRHLPVLEENKLVGMISITDLVRDVMPQQEFMIEQLESYIRGDMSMAVMQEST